MAFLDDAVHSGRNTYELPQEWSKETATAFVIVGCLAFWALAIGSIVAFAH